MSSAGASCAGASYPEAGTYLPLYLPLDALPIPMLRQEEVITQRFVRDSGGLITIVNQAPARLVTELP